MGRLPNLQKYGPAAPPGKLLFPVGERPDPIRPVVRVGAAIWRQRGLWKWTHWPPDFAVGTEMTGAVQESMGAYSVSSPRSGQKYMVDDWIPQRDLKRARSVANALAVRMDQNGFCWPSLETIAAESSFKADNIPKLVGILETVGFLHVHRGGGRQANRYWATLPEPLADRDTR
jgi:hypothetical protein